MSEGRGARGEGRTNGRIAFPLSRKRETGLGGEGLLPLLLLLLILLALPSPAAAQQPPRDARNCGVCHGELELLRQHVPSPARARELVVTEALMRGSGHDNMRCGECHTGYGTFPHPEARTATATCAGCHESADTDWAAGQHALQDAGGQIAAPCAGCHETHAVATAQALNEQPAARERMNGFCTSCHQGEALPASDPHTLEVGCWSCHAPHATHPVDDPRALVAPALQARTCGACHEEASEHWATDAHGSAMQEMLAQNGARLALPTVRETPVCTACHGGHGMLPAEHQDFAAASVELCSGCHQEYANTYFGTYHGKATALGSRIAASCADCHGSHQVFAQDDPRSLVHQANLIETCGECHANARPAFILYDSHPELGNWQRNPIITASFFFMNALLAGVFLVFGTHTLLWWIRLIIDRRRGVGHHHGPHDHHG